MLSELNIYTGKFLCFIIPLCLSMVGKWPPQDQTNIECTGLGVMKFESQHWIRHGHFFKFISTIRCPVSPTSHPSQGTWLGQSRPARPGGLMFEKAKKKQEKRHGRVTIKHQFLSLARQFGLRMIPQISWRTRIFKFLQKIRCLVTVCFLKF